MTKLNRAIARGRREQERARDGLRDARRQFEAMKLATAAAAPKMDAAARDAALMVEFSTLVRARR
jgi:hypothetical protein